MQQITPARIFSPWLFCLALCSIAWAPLMAQPSLAEDVDAQIAAFEELFRDGRQRYGTLEARMKLHKVPGLSIAVIKNRELAWAKGYGLVSTASETPINTQTVFSVGSVSKLAAAVVSLRLVHAGQLKLDQDINTYLSWWQVPPSEYTRNHPVTLRHILSHTAGFTVHGFPDFQPGEALPNVIHTLTGKAPARHGPVVVTFQPGSRFRYSGGGTTVQQLIIHQVTEQNFPEAAQKWVFGPLAMERSTYLNPIPASFGNIANAHDAQGQPTALPRGWEAMPEMAASGLWTSPSDLAKLLIALMKAHAGDGESFLSQALVADMMTPVAPSKFGLGPQLYATELFGHGGSNNSYKAQVMAHLGTGNGIVVLTNGANGRALVQEVMAAMRKQEGWSY